jgi:N-methylhydantoinase A
MFSAIGATLGNIRHDLSQALLAPLRSLSEPQLEAAFDALSLRAHGLLEAEGAQDLPVRLRRHAELRFAGQLFELRVALDEANTPLPSIDQIELAFRSEYRREFSIELPNATVQLVRLGLVAEADLASPARKLFQPFDLLAPTDAGAIETRSILGPDGLTRDVPVYRATPSQPIQTAGPALFVQAGATVWVPEAMTAHRAADVGRVILSNPREPAA